MDVRASFRLTSAYLGALPEAATVDALVEAVCAEHEKGDIPSRAIRDLVRFEATLLDLPAPASATGAPPRDDERCVIAPHVRILVYGAALPEMLAALRQGQRAKPHPARGWLVLWRGGEIILEREDGWLLESFREPTPISEAVEDDEDRALLAKLWTLGILTRA